MILECVSIIVRQDLLFIIKKFTLVIFPLAVFIFYTNIGTSKNHKLAMFKFTQWVKSRQKISVRSLNVEPVAFCGPNKLN